MSLVELDNGATHNNYSQSRKEVLDIHRQFGYSFLNAIGCILLICFIFMLVI